MKRTSDALNEVNVILRDYLKKRKCKTVKINVIINDCSKKRKRKTVKTIVTNAIIRLLLVLATACFIASYHSFYLFLKEF